jgi:hypothetical protein
MDAPPTFDAPNLDQFAQQLIAEDELGSVVRAHLHIEYYLDQLIEASVPNPGALPDLDLDYSGRVKLLSILGFSDALTKPLHNLGGLRNNFAHKLNFKLTTERMRSLYETLDPTGKQIVHLAYDNTRKKHSGPSRPQCSPPTRPARDFLRTRARRISFPMPSFSSALRRRHQRRNQ